MGHIIQALKGVESESLKSQMNVVVNTFLTHRQIGECEAFYKILPKLHMKDSNIESVYVPTGFEHNRSKFLKQITEKEAKTCKNVIVVPNKTGFFTEKPSMLDKYERRDTTENPCIQRLTYLQFNMKYRSSNEKPKSDDLKSFAYQRNQEEWNLGEEMDLIVTPEFSVSEIHYTLPRFIKLVDLRPGEPKYMKKRSRCVTRFHKVDQIKFPHEYFYSQLQLYSEFRNENNLMPNDLEKCKFLYDEKSEHNDKRKIENVQSILMPYLQSVETEKEKAEDLLENDIGDILDSAMEQDNEDCREIDLVDHPDFIFKDPTDIQEGNEIKTRYKTITLEDDVSLETMANTLDKDQRQVFEICINYAISIKKSRKANNLKLHPPLLVVQGGAGTGKSCVIHAISQHMEKILRNPGDCPDHPYILKTAFTGTAAANIKGQTLHHAFSFGFGNEFYSLSDNVRDERRCELQNLKMVIVDEFSMVKSDMLYQLDLRLREVKSKPDVLFGGVSIVLFGDILQLRPVQS